LWDIKKKKVHDNATIGTALWNDIRQFCFFLKNDPGRVGIDGAITRIYPNLNYTKILSLSR